jgi:hypothetical protein
MPGGWPAPVNFNYGKRMTTADHDHPFDALLHSDVAKQADERLKAGALALALWRMDTGWGELVAQVRLERGEGENAPRLQGVQFIYQHRSQFAVTTFWTEQGCFSSQRAALENSGAGFDLQNDLVVKVHPGNLAAFLQEARMPVFDMALFSSLAELGAPAREDIVEILARLQPDAGAPADLSEAPFDDLNFLTPVLDGAGTPAMREKLLDAAVEDFDILQNAIELDRAEIVAEILDRGAPVDKVHRYADSGAQLIHLAAASPKVVQVLLDRGASVYARNNHGETPLHSARHPEVVRALLAAGAKINSEDEIGLMPLHYALRRIRPNDDGGFDVVDRLLAAGADPFALPVEVEPGYLTPFQDAVRSGQVERAQYIIDRFPVDFAQRTTGGKTLLQLASKHADMKLFLNAAKAGAVVEAALSSSMAQETAPRAQSRMPGSGLL